MKPKKTQNQPSMHALLTPKEELATEKAVECACGREAPEQSPTREERPEEEEDVFLSPEISERSKIEKTVWADDFIGQIEYINFKRFKQLVDIVVII